MNIKEFNERLKAFAERYDDFMNDDAPEIIGNTAVSMFKDNFQNEGFFGERWQEVKRRLNPKNFKTITRGRRKGQQTAANKDGERKILTGTGDLGRSIEVKEAGDGRATVWTNPDEFAHSGKVYARVHNEGLRAGRGRGFTMPRRQFIGQHEKLRAAIIKKLEQSITTINKTL